MTATGWRGTPQGAIRLRWTARCFTLPGMRRLLLALVVVLVLAPAAQAAKPAILYSIDARSATVSKAGKAHRLALPAGSRVVWFSDRPQRHAGTLTLTDLVAIWDASGFVADPPNAAVILAEHGESRTHVVELTKPRVAGSQVSFAMTAVPGAVEAGHAHTHDVAAGSYGRAAVFIDDAATIPCPNSLTTVPLNCVSPPGQTVKVAVVPPAGQAVQASICWAAEQPLPTNGVWGGGQGFVYEGIAHFGTNGNMDLFGCNLYDQYGRELGDRPDFGPLLWLKNKGKVPLEYDWSLGPCGSAYQAGWICS